MFEWAQRSLDNGSDGKMIEVRGASRRAGLEVGG
jgi:hypothetical protein